MGIFQRRPEEPTEWAGLPAEPWEPSTDAEVLPDELTLDAALMGGITAGSISIPVPGADELPIAGDGADDD